MKSTNVKFLRWPTVRIPLLCLILVCISALVGCTAGRQRGSESLNNVAPSSSAESALPAGPVVELLPGGRQGFIIREIPGMDAGSRRNFENAIVMMHEQDYEKAIGLLEQVIERSPGVSAPYINLAIAYKQIEQPEQAEKHLKTALKLIPEHPVASNEYGLLLRQAGRFDEARSIYEKTLATFPDYQPARRNLGILCELYLNDPVCALEQYEMYSEAKPSDEQVKIWIAGLRIRIAK